MSAALRWDDCAQCGERFSQPRRPGRPAVVCSDACKRARGKNGGVRKDSASHHTGYLPVDHSVRTGRESRDIGVVADVLAGPETAARGGVVVFGPHRDNPNTTHDNWKHQRQKMTREQRRKARGRWDQKWVDALPYGGIPVGRTRPRVRDRHVIGQRDLPHDWQERLHAEDGYLA